MKKILTLVFALCSAIAAQADPPSYVDASGLRAYYYLTNDALNTMPGNPYSGTSTNPPTYNGSYARFDGVGTNPDHLILSLPNLVSGGNGSGFAISFWARATGAQSPYACFFNNFTSENKGIIIQTVGGSDNRIRVDVGDGTGYSNFIGNTPLLVVDGWVHIAVSVVYTTSGASITIYRNGKFDGYSGFLNHTYSNPGVSCEVGYDSYFNGDRAFKGDLTDLAIWNRPIQKCEASMMAVQGIYFNSHPTTLSKDVAENASITISTPMSDYNPWYVWVDQNNSPVSQVVNGGSSSTLSLSPPLTGGTFRLKLGIDNPFNNANCVVASNPITLTVTCGSVPSPSITGPSNVSVGQQGTFSIATSSGYSYGWWTNGANATTISGSTTPNFTCQFTQAGTTNIYSNYVYGPCNKTSPVKVVTVSGTTAIGEQMEDGVFGVFPNPASEQLVIKISPSQVNKAYKLTNQLGQTVMEGTFQAMQTSLNVQHLESGMYWITSGDNRQSVMVRN